ncbi:APC family permease [Asticcacaulis sp. 201]|uniref:APC family permease n=1 Tax=Asticcacaulis sp. 201 TaxID=3028787 RepID=UPI002915F840|nr:APC family permease [Asticcacaulis sp. 201]MDV6332273.1 APC family permease [Asticcacaulis sp. 201]
MTAGDKTGSTTGSKTGPRTGLWGIALYGTAMNFSIRWLATGAATGPVAITLWIVAALLFLVPLVCATLELSARFPEEGAVYAWVRETQGPFAGFMTGWLYWACNLPYFASLLFFIVNLLGKACLGIPATAGLGAVLSQPVGAFWAATAILLVVAALHARGFGVGKWLPIASAAVSVAILFFLIWAGFYLSDVTGSATDFARANYTPPFDANGAILWASIVFAFGGVEGVALMRNDVKGGVRTIVPALIVLGLFQTIGYAGGTAAMLAIVPQEIASRLGGLPDALAAALTKLHVSAWLPYLLAAAALTFLGGMSAWFGAAARLPFAIGVDHMLPKVLGRTDPKTGAPVVAITIQAVLVILIMGLSAFGATLAGAYDFVVSMGVLTFVIPYLWMFAAYWIAQKRPDAGLDWRTPGGAMGAKILAALGFIVAFTAILGSLVPSSATTDAMGDFLKLAGASAVLIAIGAVIYGTHWFRSRRTQ